MTALAVRFTTLALSVTLLLPLAMPLLRLASFVVS